jgi:hypothetical protein
MVTIKITPAIRALLWPLPGHLYRPAQNTVEAQRRHHVAGKRYPFTKDGLRCIRSNIRELADLPTTSVTGSACTICNAILPSTQVADAVEARG